MNRREVLAGGLMLATSMSANAFAVESTVRGVKIGLITGSLNPLPKVPGKTPLDIIIDQCLQMGVGNLELGSRFFGPEVKDVIAGRAPNPPTSAYLETREAQRRWRASPASLDEFTTVRARFDQAGINLFSTSNTFFDDSTDAEIDDTFRQMQALGIKVFQTNQTRVPMGPRLVPAAEKYGISPAFHTHAMVTHPDEVATPESLARLLAMSPVFRVCLDIGHFVAGNNDPVAYLREHHDKVTHIHVKDRKRNNGPNVPWGEGDTPIKECLTLIRDNRWPIIAVAEREYDGGGTPYEQTKANIDAMRAMLNA